MSTKMIKQALHYIVLLVIGLLMDSVSIAQKLPHLGDPWDQPISDPSKILVFNSLCSKANIMVDSIHYTLAVEHQKESFIKWISTNDSAFTLNGKKIIGLTLGSLKNKAQLKYAPGFAYYVPLGNEWYAGFDYQAPIADTAKVRYAFKYRF